MAKNYKLGKSANGGHTYIILPRGVVLAEWAKQTINTLVGSWPTYVRSASGQSGDVGEAGSNYYRIFTNGYSGREKGLAEILGRSDAYEKTDWVPAKVEKAVTKAKAASPKASAAPAPKAKPAARHEQKISYLRATVKAR